MGFDEAGKERVLVEVWDWQTRVLHWVNALLVISLALLMFGNEAMEGLGVAKQMRRPVKEFHAWLGYVFVLTFSLRVLWAFVGNRCARWEDIIPYAKERWKAIGQNIRWYLGGGRGAPASSVGHDPLASLFYVALFLVLASQIVTGLLLAGTEFKMFPGSLFTSGLSAPALEALEGALEEVHEFGLWFIVFFIGAHLAGLVVHEIWERKGLFSSMIHGGKYLPKDE